MSRNGDVLTNPVTGERVHVRIGTDDEPADKLLASLHIAPGGAVAGAHVHDAITERFTVMSGRVAFVLDGEERIARTGEPVEVAPGIAHDWWNAGETEAHVLVELAGEKRMLERFDAVLTTIFGLAHEGRTSPKGMPSPLQLAVIAQEFDDTIRFVSPPPIVQRAVFGVLAPIARARGLRASYPHHRDLVFGT